MDLIEDRVNLPYAFVQQSIAMQRVKLADVARAAGVHPGTASRALNPLTQDQVSRETYRRGTPGAQRPGDGPQAGGPGPPHAPAYIIALVLTHRTNPPVSPHVARGP